ncbi:MAG: archaetidylserine decarboxylase [Candidatus Thiodiazotropha weberae]|uniref:Phosphatidylserine decarboxylase proenzyme n=1 Tax=Candidatus Thiodiazotropha endoloripes TaxID=1818881 RepID=A0A1E2URI0_9GAMM|nr:archaetidylserine decarboxylase [Candidatus Thiodiazotropha endoloripes]MCG7897405.1 archaetidylserine decarboxylase [Candidatus Thiodiazotropha weberae]MCG7903533.1 archaetidylserine decarboxylase [Candidatus Thiodiazotropha weberae]MCG7914430.1 archaetidylserine decarboxylase [Candidatus Thiodiazotropha weberae]ODB85986.1 phosphatidylserine decarboxylase [Candidatus Thiodiazotropha endoloripes]ODB88020.1 phosphatidylserine decarboxylase [Candidatus Thiodiazotropha endoloripes]
MNQTEPSRKEFPQKLLEGLFVALQYLLPHHFLSALMHKLTRVELKPVKDMIIRSIVDWYNVNLQEAMESDPSRYRSFNDFFTRALRPDARPVTQLAHEIASPADGTLSQAGDIESGYLFQAKGHDYALFELLGGDQEMTSLFEEGHFATIYLSPRDYHRLHMPLAGKLRKMVHVPGRLFSVNETTCRKVPRLFARNERVICLFDTEAGPMAMILVGAIFVSSIETVWAGTVTPTRLRVSSWDYNQQQQPDSVDLEKGEEMGRFNMGSTVILLFGKDAVEWSETFTPGSPVKMGRAIAELT